MRTVVALLLISGIHVSPSLLKPVVAEDRWEDAKSKFRPIDDERRGLISAAAPESATAKPKQARRALVFYRSSGFVHSSIPYCNVAIEELGERTQAFAVDQSDSYDVFTKENLKQYDCIILNNTTAMEFPSGAHLNAFMDFILDGGGLVGIHAASDNFGRHPEARAIVGGEFGGHPWGAGGTWAFKLNDPDHVLNQAFEGEGFWHKDEIYQYKPETFVGTDVLRVLVSLDMSKDKVLDRIKDGPREVPVSWVRKAGEGRVFYTNFGHNHTTFKNPVMLRHILDGIQYAMGDLEADATPTAEIEPIKAVRAPEKN